MQYLHPKDGVYPEKVNPGRQAVNANPRRIGANPNPVSVSHGPRGRAIVIHVACYGSGPAIVVEHSKDADRRMIVSQVKFTGKLGTYDMS